MCTKQIKIEEQKSWPNKHVSGHVWWIRAGLSQKGAMRGGKLMASNIMGPSHMK